MTVKVDTNRRGVPSGNPAKRGSFQTLIEELDAGRSVPDGIPVSGAAFRAAGVIRMMRKAAALSQAELARRLGISQARVSELEAGVGAHGPSWSLMERIADACNATIYVSPDHSDEAFNVMAPTDNGHRLVAAGGE